MAPHPSNLFMLLVLLLASNSYNAIATSSSTFDNQETYYSPSDPHPPTAHHNPPSGSHGTPSHGGSTTPTTPSHGGGSYGGTPPSHHDPTPTPSHGGGGYTPTPSTPSTNPPPTGNCGTPPTVPTPSTPSNPPRGGGGYYPPTDPSTPPTPSTPSTPSTPTPIVIPPPTPPTVTPPTPGIPSSPPIVIDPNSPFTCNYWRNNPGMVWGILGWWGTMGNAFGAPNGQLPGLTGGGMTFQQALSNTRNDGYGLLYREGTASLLNSLVSNHFPFSPTQVRNTFVAALSSNKAAASQGRVFKLANEGHLKLKP